MRQELTEVYRNIPQTFSTDSLEDLISYARMYAALYELVTINRMDEIYGSRDDYARAIKAIYRKLEEFAWKTRSTTEKARALWTRFHLEQATTVYLGGNDNADGKTMDFISDYFENKAATPGRLSDRESEEHFEMTRLAIAFTFGNHSYAQPWRGFIDLKFGQWNSSLGKDGFWKGLDIFCALRRLYLLNYFSYMANGGKLSQPLLKAYNAYIRLASAKVVEERTVANLRLYYDILSENIVKGTSARMANDLVNALYVIQNDRLLGHSERLFCTSIRVHRICINEESPRTA